MRLGKFLAHAGIASRRRAEDLVHAGRVSVGGITVRDPARDVDERSDVAVDGKPVTGAEPQEIWALHKPAGVVSTAKDTHGRRTVLDLVSQAKGRLYPVGRLDADTTGAILLTNDGQLAHRLAHPRYKVEKVYEAEIGGNPGEAVLQQLRDGVELDDGRTAPAQVRRIGPHTLELIIHEGRNRQVKRMLDAVGHPVRSLHRSTYAGLTLQGLRSGHSRPLTPKEIDRLRAL
jgi:23S rRNA pseudouridine2605 synthase